MTQHWTDRLSDYLDGHLPDGDRALLEVHLRGCAECRETLEDLRRLVARANTASERPLPTDLWPGIAALIGSSGSPSPVIDLGRERARRRLSFTLPQLAAAAFGAHLVLFADRFPRRWSISLALAAIGVGFTVLAVAPGPWTAALALILFAPATDVSTSTAQVALVKASGGIKEKWQALEMLRAGAAVVGTSHGPAICS